MFPKELMLKLIYDLYFSLFPLCLRLLLRRRRVLLKFYIEKKRIIFNYWFDMETNRLKQFCVVNETKNLRKAAELLNMSHSALSKSMKVLQEELGLQLLEQVGRGIVTTEEGRLFVQKAQALLDFENQILKKSEPIQKQFKIGSFESFSTHLIGMNWHKYFGDGNLQIHELSSGQIERAVLNSTIDAGITFEPVPTADLDFINLGKIQMGVFHRRGFFDRTPFADLPFVVPLMPSTGVPTTEKGLDGWPDHLLRRNIRYRADLMESGLSLARSGQAAIFIPRFVARAQNEALAKDYKLIEREYPEDMKPVSRRIFLVVKASRQKEITIKKLIEMLKKECS